MVRFTFRSIFTAACAVTAAIVSIEDQRVDATSPPAIILSAAANPPRRPVDVDQNAPSKTEDELDFAWPDDYDPDWGSLVGPFGQCGGDDYDGPCECVENWTCYEFNSGYAQCVPTDLISSFSHATTVTSTSASDMSSSDDPCTPDPSPTDGSLGPNADPSPTPTPQPSTNDPSSEPAGDGSTATTSTEPPVDTPTATTVEPTTATPTSAPTPEPEPTPDAPVDSTVVPPDTPSMSTVEPTLAPVTPAPSSSATPEPTSLAEEPTRSTSPLSTQITPTDEPSTSAPTTTSKPPPTQTQLVGAWQQCGGKDFDSTPSGQATTATLSCVRGYQCDTINEFFAQCVPSHEPSHGSYWAQCGGQGFSGPTICTTGSMCTYYNDWYSQCVPDA